jgi:hypothetical protein
MDQMWSMVLTVRVVDKRKEEGQQRLALSHPSPKTRWNQKPDLRWLEPEPWKRTTQMRVALMKVALGGYGVMVERFGVEWVSVQCNASL